MDNLLRIRIFVAVYEERSFTAAAHREHLTQSGVTQHIQKLEEYFRVRLFQRSTAGITPTPAATNYYRSCIELLRIHRQARTAVRECEQGLTGHICVGLPPVITRAVLAPTLASFIRENANVRVSVIEGDDVSLLRSVRAADIDFCITSDAPHAHSSLYCERIAVTPEYLVSGRHSGLGLCHGEPLRIQDVQDLSFVFPTTSPRRVMLDRFLRTAEARLLRTVEVDTVLGTLDLIAHTEWVTIFPAVMVLRDVMESDHVVNPLYGPELSSEIYLVRRSSDELGEASLAFAESLSQRAALMARRATKLAQAS